MDFVRVCETLMDHRAQLDRVAIAEKAWQRCVGEHGFGNSQRHARIAAKLARFGLSDCDHTVSRQIVGCSEIKRSVP